MNRMKNRRSARWWKVAERDAEGDVETVLGLMAPDAMFLTAGQPPMTGAKRSRAG